MTAVARLLLPAWGVKRQEASPGRLGSLVVCLVAVSAVSSVSLGTGRPVLQRVPVDGPGLHRLPASRSFLTLAMAGCDGFPVNLA